MARKKNLDPVVSISQLNVFHNGIYLSVDNPDNAGPCPQDFQIWGNNLRMLSINMAVQMVRHPEFFTIIQDACNIYLESGKEIAAYDLTPPDNSQQKN